MNVILIGPPAAGKGTQAAALAAATNLTHIATGELVRQEMQHDTDLGELAHSFADQGELLPDQVITKMLLERIHQPDSTAGVILDGFPRTLNQAQLLTDALEERQTTIDAVLSMAVPSDILLKRITGRRICRQCETPYNIYEAPPQAPDRCDHCGDTLYSRPDDTAATAQHRLEVYEEHTLPLLAYYRDRGLLSEVDGQGAIQEVTDRLLHALEQAIQRKDRAR